MTLFAGLWPLKRKQVMKDIQAGLSLASVNIPQVLGYTSIAGTPVITGLYTVLLPLLGFAIFGASRHLVVAADSATAAIFANGLSHLAAPGSAHYMTMVGMVALLTAAILLIARLLKLGFISDFLSRTVLTGFLAGVGIQVSVAMLGNLLGLVITERRTLNQLWQTLTLLPDVHVPTALLGGAVLLAILLGRRFLPRLPVAMLCVAGSITYGVSHGFGNSGIRVIGAVPGGLPGLGLPLLPWHTVVGLIPLALSCAVIILAQSAAAARVYALRYHEEEDGNANILGLAAANAAAACSGTFVVNGSPTQTAMAEQAGARSQLAQLVFAGVVAVVLLFFTPWLAYLPHCVLAAIVFAIALHMIDLGALAAIRAESRGEFRLATITALTVAAVGVEQGLLLAILLSLLRHVRHSYQPHTAILQADADGHLQATAPEPGQVTAPGILVYQFGADLFYANDHHFCDEIRQLLAAPATKVNWLIVDAAAISNIDFSAARSLASLCAELQEQNVQLLFARSPDSLSADLARHRLEDIANFHTFKTLHDAIRSIPGHSGGKHSLAPPLN